MESKQKSNLLKNKDTEKHKFINQIYNIENIDLYLGLTTIELSEILKVSNNTASITRKLSKKLLKDANFRSVRRSINKNIKESIPLDNINFKELIYEKFESSSLYTRSKQGFYFLVYDEINKKNKSLVLRYGFLWKPNEKIIKTLVCPFWSNVKKTTKNGIEIKRVKRGKRYINQNNLPKSKDNPMLHVRPKAKNAKDTIPLPCGGKITKQAYWINSSYIKKIIDYIEDETLKSKESQYEELLYSEYVIRENISNMEYSSERYKEKLDKYSELKVIYTKNNYKKQRRTYKYNNNLLEIIENDYQMKYGYYINKAFDSITEAIKYDVINLNYLNINDYEYKSYSVIDNLLRELKKDLEIIEIKKDMYITKKTLKNGGVILEDILKYIDEVIIFAKKESSYFNINILRNNDVGKKMFELGFQDIFYEEILKNSEEFQYQTYRSNIIFTINKVEKSVYTDLVMKYVISLSEIYRYEINEMFQEKFEITNLNETDILTLYDEDKDIYYCPHMDMFFEDRERYLDIILRRKNNGIIK